MQITIDLKCPQCHSGNIITGLTAGYVTDYGMLMLAVSICTLPTLLLFVTQQKRFVAGVLGS